MKKKFMLIGFILFTNILFGQNKVDSLIKQGIKCHDLRQYISAIDFYKKALEIEPNSSKANYEIAMTYMYTGDYEKSIKHSDIVINLNDEHLLMAITTKGSSLDCLGRTDESIKLFKEGIKKFGDNYLLYYNLGCDYYSKKDYDNALEALQNAIKAKRDHASSHLMLGYVMAGLNKKVQSLLCLHYFLFLEPGSERSKTAYKLLQQQFLGNVEKDKDKQNHVNIFMDPNQKDKEFGTADLLLSMMGAATTFEPHKGKTEDEIFIDNTKSLFHFLGEVKKKENVGLWWDTYVPFFASLAESENMEAYCYYISKSSNAKAVDWLKNNSDKVDRFTKWMRINKIAK
jgi:tetratricopeptide (TPR) repeat protein